MEFVEAYPLKDLTPADYNPRKISEEGFSALQESLKKFGIVKPVILNGINRVLTAGHQRTKAMKAIGIKTTPIIILPDISRQDEIRFNLLHNKIEMNKSKVSVKNPGDIPLGYSFISFDDIEIHERDNAPILSECCRLITKYGPWGSIVIDEAGNCIQNAEYAVSCHQMKQPVLIYKMRRGLVREFLKYCKVDYGEYYYAELEGLKSYNQTYCQMHRLRDTGSERARSLASRLYEKLALPLIQDGSQRVVDFGAGQMDYVKRLTKRGIPILGYEPFHRTSGKNSFNIPKVVSFIQAIERDVRQKGLFDVVILDSVINSVINKAFEDYVLTACNALCAKDATFCIGTRNDPSAFERLTYMRQNTGRKIEFLDKDNFSLVFRQGAFTMQHFHTSESLTVLLLKYFKKVEMIITHGTQLVAKCEGPKNLSLSRYEAALEVEFNMEYPGNFHHNRHGKLISTLIESLKKRGVK